MKAFFQKTIEYISDRFHRVGGAAAAAFRAASKRIACLFDCGIGGVLKASGAVMTVMGEKKRSFSKLLYRSTAFAVMTIVVLSAPAFNRITFAYEVRFGGETIGYISDESVLGKAENIAKDSADDSRELPTEPQLNFTIVSNDQLISADDLSDKLYGGALSTRRGDGVFINGKFAFAVSSLGIAQNALESLTAEYKKATGADSARVAERISYAAGVFGTARFVDAAGAAGLLRKALTVTTTAEVKKTESIAYGTDTVSDSSQYIDYKKVISKGKNGVKALLCEQVYVNGVLQSEEVIDEEIVKAPVNQRMAVGTKKRNRSVKHSESASLIWPLERKENEYISQHFGEDGHKGIDIAIYHGTRIFAAHAGTVIEVIHSNSGYGNRLRIKDSSGFVTLYAHCSEIHVKKGDTVNAGDEIAKVGSTGKSTGPHLHFEVIVGDERQDPAPYLGLS